MIAKIVHLLQQRKPNAPQEWLKKLPQMAKRLEESLYRSAKSFEQYNDATTLKHRLQQLAVNIGMKTKKMQQAQMAQHKPPQPPAQQQQPAQHAQYYPPPNPQQPQQGHRAPAPQPVQARPAQPQPIQQRQHQPMQQQPQVQAPPPLQQQQQPPQQQQRIVNVAEINPIMGGQSQPHVQPSPQPAPAPQSHVQYQQPAPVPAAPAPGAPLAPVQNGVIPPAGAAGTSRQVSDRQQVLRHQQQRLLLLRHAAKCQHDDGRCPVTPHCAGMKRLWKHIAECKDQKCLVPHCVSSRYVLSHYHRCKDVRCPVCGPVREAIHRSHEKQKQMQALKQRHQQAVNQTGGPPAPTSSAPAPVAPAPLAAPLSAPTSIVAPVGSGAPEPPHKRQKKANAVPGQPFPPQPGMPQQPLHQPSAARPMPPQSGAPPGQQLPPGQFRAPIPGQTPQPGIPGVKPSSVPSGPPGARPGVTAAPGIAFSNGQVITPKYTGPKPQEDHTLINCFSVAQIETHINSLNKGIRLSPPKLKTKCMEVLKVLQAHQHGWVFNSPVDPVELGLPDYFEVIKQPMDLGTIRKKLENGVYHSLKEFEGHCHVTFDNAMMYNPQGSVVYNMAEEMKIKFAQDFAILMKQLDAEEDVKRKNGEACLLCGCEKLLFEPPVFYCNGSNCPSKRIRRNSHYYVAGNNQYHWCHLCYQELKDNQKMELADVSVTKEGLTKKKNDEVHEESWVQCDRCERWIHQICALFNTRQNKDQRSEYACPHCTIAERKKKGQFDPISITPMAEDLPRTLLSEQLEAHVRKKVDEYVETNALAKAEREKMPIEQARKSLQMGGHITIRQVTSMDRKLEVRERMKRRYAFRNYPDEFSFRCKCIVVFQNLDGVDVMLFGLYVYEHEDDNPLPNKKTVYVSYLDSVHYMRPRKMRTFIYHEILIAYLDSVRKRDFTSAHIWACPPLKGDDYILYAKPEDQKVPKDDRLRQWYIDMLVECQRRGVVGKVTNMYDLYFANSKNDATIVPYMDGDYFPAEVENIIKDIEEGKTGKKGNSQGKKKKNQNNKAKQKKKNGRGGTRSTGLDEEALKASGLAQQDEGKSLEEGGRDYVMVKLGETIQPMKDSFIVAFLAWDGARPQDMVVPKEIQEYRTKHGIVTKFDNVNSVEGRDVVMSEAIDEKKDSLELEVQKDADKASTDDSAKDPSTKEKESPGFATASTDTGKPTTDTGQQPMETDSPVQMMKTDSPVADTTKAKEEPKDESKEASKEEPAKDSKVETNDSKVETKDAAKDELKVESNDKAKEESKDGSATEKSKDNTKDEAKMESKDSSKDEANEESKDEANEESKDEAKKESKDDPKDAAMADADSDPKAKPTDGSDAKAAENAKSTDAAKPPEIADASTEAKKPESSDVTPAPTEATPAPEKDVATTTSDTAKADPTNSKAEAGPIAASGANVSVPADGPPAAVAAAAEVSSTAVSGSTVTPAVAIAPPLAPSAPSPAGITPVLAPATDGPTATPTPGDATSASDAASVPGVMAIRKGKFAAMSKKKRDVDGNTKDPEEENKEKDKKPEKKDKKPPAKAIYVKDSKGRTVKVLDDGDEELDCEFLNNRQAFLNLCQGNHYQFDHLRRAKHSSMMVLWHLHNRDAPKFVQQCATCSREILSGYRFHCPTCADFDQCHDCVQNPKVTRHPHQLKPIPVASGQQPELTEEQRKERQRSIQLHMTLLQHAATCTSTACPSANCTKMKGLLKHGGSCQIKATGGCNVCKRIWALLQIHARQCKASPCPVPNCMAIRERVRQLKKQQQAMDDRRRQEMNRAYHR